MGPALRTPTDKWRMPHTGAARCCVRNRTSDGAFVLKKRCFFLISLELRWNFPSHAPSHGFLTQPREVNIMICTLWRRNWKCKGMKVNGRAQPRSGQWRWSNKAAHWSSMCSLRSSASWLPSLCGPGEPKKGWEHSKLILYWLCVDSQVKRTSKYLPRGLPYIVKFYSEIHILES